MSELPTLRGGHAAEVDSMMRSERSRAQLSPWQRDRAGTGGSPGRPGAPGAARGGR